MRLVAVAAVWCVASPLALVVGRADAARGPVELVSGPPAARCDAGAATASAPGRPTGTIAWRARPLAPVRPLAEPPRARSPAASRPSPGRLPAAGRPSLDRSPAARARVGTLDPALHPWLLVLAVARGEDGRCWARLRLPVRPNDASGWVPAERLRLVPTRWRIEISRAARTLTLLRDGRQRVRSRVVIGAPATTTPGGLFAVAGAWRNDPRDFSGAWIVALTAHSRALRRFDGGEGRVAIHGRGGASLRDPLGSARSHGCVRVANGDLDRLVRTVGRWRLVGVPVRVR